MPINLIIRNPLDRDAREFIQRAGVTDAGGRAQLNTFVRGVKNLGLWNSIVCWPLRSSQNAGTGTTAFSLGGLGTHNGTLVDGPTWASDGIDFDGTNDHITTSFNPAFNNITVFTAAKADNDTTRRVLVSQRNNSAAPIEGYNIYSEGSAFGTIRNLTAEVYDTFWRISNAGQITLSTWFSAGLYWDKSFVTGFRDAQVGTPAAASFTGSRTLVIGSNGGFWWDGRISAVIVVHNQGNVFASLRSLYRNTLGTGLGLP